MQSIRSMPAEERSMVEQQPSSVLFPYIGIKFATGSKRRHSDDEQGIISSQLTGRDPKPRSHRRVRRRLRSPSPLGRHAQYSLTLWSEDMTHMQDRAVIDQSFLTESEWPSPPDGASFDDDKAYESVLGSELSDVDSDVGRSRASSKTPMPAAPSSRSARATPDVAVVETDLEPSDLSDTDSVPSTPTTTKLRLGSHEIGPRRIVSDEYEADDEEEEASEAEAAIVRLPIRAIRGRSAPIGLGPAPVRRGIKRSSCPPHLALEAEAPLDDLVRELGDLRTASLGSMTGTGPTPQQATDSSPVQEPASPQTRQYMRSKVDDYRRRMVLFGKMPRHEVPVRPFRPSSPRRRSSARTSTRETDVRMLSESDTASSAMDIDDDASLALADTAEAQVPVAVRLEGRSAFDLRPKHASRSRVERQRTLNSRKLHRTSPTSLLPLREHHRGSWAAPEASSFHSIRHRVAARRARRDAVAQHNASSMNGGWTQVVGNWAGIEDVWQAQKDSGWWFNQAQQSAVAGSAGRERPSEDLEQSYRPESAPSDIELTEDEDSSADELEEDGPNPGREAGFGLDVSVDDEEEDDLSLDEFDEDAQPLGAEWYEVESGISPLPVAPASPSMTVISISSDDSEASIASEAISEASSTWSAPPNYDRVVRSASPLPLVAPIAIRAAQARASVPPRPSTPPGYHPAMYSRRSPSPPPPYNAQPANERVEVSIPTTLARAPYRPRRELPVGSIDLGALAHAAAQLDRSQREYTPMHIWVGSDEDEVVGGDAFDEYVEPPMVGSFPTEQPLVPERNYSHLYDRYDRATSVASAFDLGPDLEEGEDWEGMLEGDTGEQESATATAPVAARLWTALTGWFGGRQ